VTAQLYKTESECGLWCTPNWNVLVNLMTITICEASKWWADASTRWPPMREINGLPCRSSVLRQNTLIIMTDRSDQALLNATVARAK
jgi:hypothetical protein